MRILFLDDNPLRASTFLRKYPDAKWVETADDCILELSSTPYKQVYLDHDLDGKVYVDPANDNTGSGVVRYIVKNKDIINHETEFIVHSYNDKAAIEMVKQLRKAGFQASYQPFGAEHSKERDDYVDAVCDEAFDMPGAIIIARDD